MFASDITPTSTPLHLLNLRYSSREDSTLGLLFQVFALEDGEVGEPRRNWLCHTLEDEHRDVKVPGETRIGEGTYEITLRTVGGFHARFTKKYGRSFHKGMLWIREVPGFEYILIHPGNDDDDTAGCLLVGDSARENVTRSGFVGESNRAYRRIYTPIAQHLVAGGRAFITYKDYA